MKGPVFHRLLRFCLTDRVAQEAAAAEGETLSSVMRRRCGSGWPIAVSAQSSYQNQEVFAFANYMNKQPGSAYSGSTPIPRP